MLTEDRHTRAGWHASGRRLLAAIVVGVVVLSGLASTEVAADVPGSRRAVQQRRVRAARAIDALRATDAQVARALVTLSDQVRVQTAEVVAARQAAAAAAAQERKVQAALVRTRARVAKNRSALRATAIDEFIAPRRDPATPASTRSLSELARLQVFAGLAAVTTTDVLDGLRAANEDLEVSREQAAAAMAAVAARQRRVTARLLATTSARQAQRALASRVEARLEQRLGEAAALAQLDSRLAAQILRRQSRLARRIGPVHGARGPVRAIRGVRVRTVGGITVASHIAGRLASLLSAARRDGVRFGGGGYRDPSQQVATRRRNCGSSSYDVYRKPASRCRPPTARPGQSMHERALAVDFTANGRIVRSGSAGHRWLRRNAGRYGFRNLPGEPWHWSTNGR